MKTPHKEVEEKFSVPLFLFTMAWSLAVIAGTYWFFAAWLPVHFGYKPTYWEIQFNAAGWRYGLVFTAFQGCDCFAEWLFHRYVLHAPLIPGFQSLFYKHDRRHHMLTHITILDSGPGGKTWRSAFAILKQSQFETSYFPWYTMLGFAVTISIVAVPLQLLLPNWPIFGCAIVSVAWSLTVYEIVHMIQHWPAPFWKTLITLVGRPAEVAFSYHAEHHAHMHATNENISGICGFPVADIVMGTLKIPQSLQFTGEKVILGDEILPVPRFALIRWLDSKAAAARERYENDKIAKRRKSDSLPMAA